MLVPTVLALAESPEFDPNNYYQESDLGIFQTDATQKKFEPGSVFKIVTASAALEEKKVTEEDKFFCENGTYKVGGHILHDHRPHGVLTFRQVIEESSNIGTVKVAQLLGADKLYQYLKAFGFGSKLGFGLSG